MNRRLLPVESLPALSSAVFVQPHCDDAVLSSFGLLSRVLSGTIVTVFAGVPGPAVARHRGGTVPVGVTPYEWMTARRAEDRAALATFPVDVTHLDLLELQFRDDPDESGLIGAVSSALEECCGPSVTVIVAPIGIGGNPNHVQVASAVHSVSRARELPVIWCADYPYAARPSWPAWVDGDGEMPREWALVLGAVDAATAECTVVCLPEAAQQRKLEAFSVYSSQVGPTERGEERAVSHPSRVRLETYFAPPGLLGGD